MKSRVEYFCSAKGAQYVCSAKGAQYVCGAKGAQYDSQGQARSASPLVKQYKIVDEP